MRTILTYEDYAELPSGDGWRYEIHDGELSVTPSPTFRHQQIIVRLLDVLYRHVVALDLGEIVPSPVTVVLSDTNIVQPDIVFITRERMGIVSTRGTIDGPPTLAIEVLSPSTARIDRQTKKQLFERYGVPYCWIVDTDARVIEMYELVANAYGAPDRRSDDLNGLPPFRDLTIDATALWR